MANLAKAVDFYRQRNLVQTIRYGEIAATRLKQLKDRRLETVQAISDALTHKFDALQLMGRHREGLECVKERYTLWAMNHLRNPASMDAALSLIQSCLQNKEYEDAESYARHAYFMIAEMTDNFIPVDQQPRFLAEGSYYLALTIFRLSEAGGIPPEAKQKAGEEAIAFAREALGMYTQLYGAESVKVAMAMGALAVALDHFNNVDDNEVLRFLEQANAIYRRLVGSSSPNVAVAEHKLGFAYISRAKRAQAVNDLDRCMTNQELALSRYREAARIYKVINHMDMADDADRLIAQLEEWIQEIGIIRAAQAAQAASTRS